MHTLVRSVWSAASTFFHLQIRIRIRISFLYLIGYSTRKNQFSCSLAQPTSHETGFQHWRSVVLHSQSTTYKKAVMWRVKRVGTAPMSNYMAADVKMFDGSTPDWILHETQFHYLSSYEYSPIYSRYIPCSSSTFHRRTLLHRSHNLFIYLFIYKALSKNYQNVHFPGLISMLRTMWTPGVQGFSGITRSVDFVWKSGLGLEGWIRTWSVVDAIGRCILWIG